MTVAPRCVTHVSLVVICVSLSVLQCLERPVILNSFIVICGHLLFLVSLVTNTISLYLTIALIIPGRFL